jgi:gliding motility-associated-like protein
VFWICLSPSNYLDVNAEYNAAFTAADHGKFVFIGKFYGECRGLVSLFNNFNLPFVVGGYTGPGPNSSPSLLVSVTDISPDCYNIDLAWRCGPPIMSNSASGPLNGTGAVAEWVFRSEAMQLIGSPPVNGSWTISIGPHCCRNPAANIVTMTDFFLKSEMFPFPAVANPRSHGALPPFLSMYPCYDNSPTFLELPNVTACLGSNFGYGPLAFDSELDSLVYDWATPLSNANTPLNFSSSFSFDSPLPSSPPSEGASLDPITGVIYFNSHIAGAYTTNTEVIAYRCGLPVAAIYRDIQIYVANCEAAYSGANPPITPPTNSPPQVTFVPDSNLAITSPAPFTYRIEVEAGMEINFTLNAQDFDLLPGNQFQNISFIAAGGQLGGSGWNDTNACDFPPCAIVTPSSGQTGFVSIMNNTIDFYWKTECSHLASNLGCDVFSNEYVFYLKMEDDFCPTPARTLITLIVSIQPGNPSPPIISCVSQLESMLALNFIPEPDTGFRFNYHLIQIDTNNSGNFFNLDTVFDYNPGTLLYQNNFSGPVYFRILTNLGCGFFSQASNTVGSISLDIEALPLTGRFIDTAYLTWNNPRPFETDSIDYLVEMEFPIGSGDWVTIGNTFDRAFKHHILVCSLEVKFRVSYEVFSNDTVLNCVNYSNYAKELFFGIKNPTEMIYISETKIRGDGIYLRGFIDGNSYANGIIIERASEINGSYFELARIIIPEAPHFSFSYVDYLPRPHDDIYFYRLRSYSDTCEFYFTHSNAMNNIKVEVEAKSSEQNWVSWNAHEGFAGNLEHYELYRSDGENSPLNLIASEIEPSRTIYVDNIRSVSGNAPRFCYQVRAIEQNNLLPLPETFKPFTSISNTACITQKAKVILPNAFRPLSNIEENRTFGVKNRFIDRDHFSFIILDRWGKVIFETNDPNMEWNGYHNGKLAPTGVYTYFIRYQSVGGLPEEIKGTFTLIQ